MDFMRMLREEKEKARATAAATAKKATDDVVSSSLSSLPSPSPLSSPSSSSSPSSFSSVKLTEGNDKFVIEQERGLLQSMSYDYVDMSMPYATGKEMYKIGLIPTMYYFPNVISEEDETKLLSNIQKYDKNWTNLRGRKLQCWGGNPDGSHSQDDIFAHLSPWLSHLATSLVRNGVFQESNHPNHVLINQYNDAEGIIHHTDGPKYFNCVAILSLQSTRLMTFRKRLRSDEVGVKYGGDLFSVCLKPRSMLIFQDDLYIDYLHGLSDSKEVDIIDEEDVECLNKEIAGVISGEKILREKRTSLTIRRMFSSSEG